MTRPSSKAAIPHLDATIHIGKQENTRKRAHTEDFVAAVVLPNKITQDLLIYTGPVGNLVKIWKSARMLSLVN